MSLLLNQPSKLCFRRPGLVRSSPPLSNNGLSTSLPQTPPCFIVSVDRWGARHTNEGELVIKNANERDKWESMELLCSKETVTIESSHCWVATLKENPKRIPLPPLLTMPDKQTQIVTNVAMSSSSPEDEDCVVAVKFLGPRLSFCRPAQSKSGWINVTVAHPCLYSSRVMFSKRDKMFHIPGSGGHLIGSYDIRKREDYYREYYFKWQSLQSQSLPNLRKTDWKLLDSCCKSDHLVESPFGVKFLVKWYRKTAGKIINGIAKMKTKAVMVFELDEEGDALYTQHIGDLCIFLSNSEAFCIPASSVPGLRSNQVIFYDGDETGVCYLHDSTIIRRAHPTFEFDNNYLIPPQTLDKVFL